ncbi:TolC family protein [Albibacterium sp.]|uniref:TolC family protein n=1 Tax=Albibacterium sp. TaxID=2952885 RepID=UPI002CE368D1|nr:TolC family protein [Albibacterium sp.]HUH19184.1 TolC family protein [Albibacterium sp.]
MNYVNMGNLKHMMLRIRYIYLFFLLMPINLFAQDSLSLSLEDILTRIEMQNVALESYALKVESYKYKSEAASSWMAPMVGAGTYMTPYPGQDPMEDDKGSLMFQVEQDIPNFSKQKANQKAIISLGDIEYANRDLKMNDLKAQAKSLYFGWLIALDRIQVLRENEKIMQTMREVEEIRYKYNQSQLGSIFNIDAKIEENQNMILMQEGEIAKSRAWLNSLMNQRGDVLFSIDTSEKLVFVPQVILDTATLANQRADIVKMEREIASMKLGVEVMKKESRPGLKIRFDHMSPLGAGMMPNSYSIMGMISIPIAPWSSKMYKNEISAMNLEVDAMQKERQGKLLESQGVVYGMQYEILNTQKRLENLELKIIPSLKRALDANFQSYQENKIQLPVIIDNWEAWNMMQNNLLDEKLMFYQLIIDYEKELFR